MFGLNISFVAPLLLWALVLLPVLWWILRAVPPAPLRAHFPGILLLLGLKDKETTPDRTPWWLLALRIAVLGAAIIGFAAPILNPTDAKPSNKNLIVLMDASWASASDWKQRQDKLTEVLRGAAQNNQPTVVLQLSDRPKPGVVLNFASPSVSLQRVASLVPNAWRPDYAEWQSYLSTQKGSFDTIWFSDGLETVDRAALMEVLSEKGDVSVVQSDRPVLAMAPPVVKDDNMVVKVKRSFADTALDVTVNAVGPDPNGMMQILGVSNGRFSGNETETELVFDLPVELRNRVKSVAIEGRRSAGAVAVTGDTIQRRKVGIIAPSEQQEGSNLVSDVFYLRKALVPTADVIEADLKTTLQANPDVLIFVDIGKLSTTDTDSVLKWTEEGGLLVRFAGSRLAASQIGLREEHPLLPVRLRAGGRSVGGAMSWGAPKKIQDFVEGTNFFGLKVPDDVSINSQVIAQPDPNLAERVVAELQDGTPLVTQKTVGNGRVVLFHVTANADWSNLPLSGLFVQMLDRLAVSTSGTLNDIDDLEGLIWKPEETIDAFGAVRNVTGLAGVQGEQLATKVVSADLPAGVYGNAGRKAALNVIAQDQVLNRADWPLGTSFLSLGKTAQVFLKPYILIAAFVLLLLDIFASLWLSGKLTKRYVGQIAVVVLLTTLGLSEKGYAQSDVDIAKIINNTVLGYVKTGDAKVDRASEAGLLGLSAELRRRTSVEPISPVGVNIEIDELSLYPFLYWPMSENQKPPSEAAVDKLNRFLRSGGMILFDTRDAHLSFAGAGGTANGRVLKKIATQLEIPPLEPVPEDHVLARSFYLMKEFPGRHVGANVWIEASQADSTEIEGVPFRNANDGVTPVVIGANDWAAAWAIDQNGRYLFPVGRGQAGQLQREYAQRFGVNLIMYVLTGNYKSDQVHVPALLDRLGQ
ncbi:DUF4159 domain-containing protein [Amylibacter sp. SFDW26]|uniref:DUF4159 domain-containing protein n=1 Tax=Amylibacter sp. SFDW26 TaxID=2652722 RepID=UPI0012622CB3|nr:DUF4159 domain-containing protein [Amylibacter sp. SFDW26]KAB7613876.1 DUF4159 domain-containing protein [Amylibacter sp. SFDW26]